MNEEYEGKVVQTPEVCIYHGNCADGFGAAWAVWKRYPDIEFFAGVYGEPMIPFDMIQNKHVVMVDFSYALDDMEALIRHAQSVTVLDHHKTAQDAIKPLLEGGLVRGEFDMDRSGAIMAWDYYHPDQEPPRLLKHIQDRDLWQFKLPNTREIQSALFSYPYDFDVWDEIISDGLNGVRKLVQEGRSIERKHFKDINEIMTANLYSMVIGGHRVPVLNVPYTMASDACHLMCKQHFEFLNGPPKFAASYYDKPGQRIFSLRSIGSTDVSAIAKQYGGGGHVNAAGFARPIGWSGDEE